MTIDPDDYPFHAWSACPDIWDRVFAVTARDSDVDDPVLWTPLFFHLHDRRKALHDQRDCWLNCGRPRPFGKTL